MSLRSCMDISEASSLESSLGLYLKPTSKIKANVQLPKLNHPGQSISTWHVMEKIKETIRPDSFIYLKCMKITSMVIKFEGELETKAACDRALARLRAAGFVKLSGFADRLQIRAAHAECAGPTRHDWESFFRDAKGGNEMKPGERPDTIKLEELPVRWFSEVGKPSVPSEKLLRKAFETFGRIRRVEIPPPNSHNLDRNVFGKTSSLHNDLLFEVYIQYENYVEFVIAMESLRGKKLLYKDPEGKVFAADIKVDFDRTYYLSEKNIKKRSLELKELLMRAYTDNQKTQAKEETAKPPQILKAPISETNVVESVTNTSSSTTENLQRQNEAKFLLKELLSRAEIAEKQKEKPKAALKSNSESKDSEETKTHKDHVKEDKHANQTKKTPPADARTIKSMKREAPKEEKTNVKTPSPKKRDKHSKTIEKSAKSVAKVSVDYSKEKETKRIEQENEMRLLQEKRLKERLIYSLKQKKEKEEMMLLEKERSIKQKLLRNLKLREEQKLKEREQLRKKLAGSKLLKSVLGNSSTSSCKTKRTHKR